MATAKKLKLISQTKKGGKSFSLGKFTTREEIVYNKLNEPQKQRLYTRLQVSLSLNFSLWEIKELKLNCLSALFFA